MGAGQSIDSEGRRSSPEELSQILADRFATKCFTPLELTHLKDNFYSRALDQGGLRYWNEEILSRFLGIPDDASSTTGAQNGTGGAIDAGPVIFRMVSYLGAFPFQNTLAPSVLTFEALVKVTVLLTERYGKVLRRGRKDRIKLLFGSLADIGRKDLLGEKGMRPDETQEQSSSSSRPPETENTTSHVTGFSIDEPVNDEDEDDDDDLALAALESLDAIEVFKHDQRVDRTVYEASISVDTFRRLLMLLLSTASLGSRDDINKYISNLNKDSVEAINSQVDSILEPFGAAELNSRISYQGFSRAITNTLPYLFDPLTFLFERLLFSENLDLSRLRGPSSTDTAEEKNPASPRQGEQPPPPLTPVMLTGSFESKILNSALLSHLSFFLATSSPVPNLLHNQTRLHPVFSSSVHGESLTSFSHNVLTWQAPSLLFLNGTDSSSPQEQMVTIGAYLPQPWKPSSSTARKSPDAYDLSSLPCLFQLSPAHKVLSGSPSYHKLRSNMPVVSFSPKTGIALGCIIPPSSRGSIGSEPLPKPTGGGSLMLDPALENATFIVSDGLNGEGVFLPPNVSPTSPSWISTSAKSSTTNITIYNLEVWGIVPAQPSSGGSLGASSGTPMQQHDAIALQKSHWNFEARDAERRRNINMHVGGGDSEEQSGRALLEMAGIIGDSRNGKYRR